MLTILLALLGCGDATTTTSDTLEWSTVDLVCNGSVAPWPVPDPTPVIAHARVVTEDAIFWAVVGAYGSETANIACSSSDDVVTVTYAQVADD